MKFANGRGPPKRATSLSKAIWGKVSPFALYRKLPESTVLKSIGRYVRTMQPGRTEEENVAMENYLFQILLRPGTSEYALFQQWERALDVFDDMKYKRMPVTVVSYGKDAF